MATKDKDKKGPSTQSTGTQGVNAVGVNHGTKPNYAPGFTDVAGSPSYQQYGQQYPQQAPVVSQPVQQVGAQVPTQTSANQQQNVVQSQVQTTPTAIATQPVQQQFALPQQITVGGKTITLQQPQQPVQQQVGALPQQVTIGNNTYQVPTQTGTNTPTPQQKPAEKSAAQQNEEYERQKVYNQAVDEYLKAGGDYNSVRPHSDPNMERMKPTAEQTKKVNEYNEAQAKKEADKEDEYVKTLKEYLDSKYESPKDREEREKREARQRKWSAISEGIANVFNVGGSIAGAQPAQWKSAVGDLYANQEAESDKRRSEYKEALKDLITYKTALRNGDIALARSIEEKRKNDIYEYRIMQEMEGKAAERQLKAEQQAANEKRAQQKAEDQHRAANTKEEIDRQKLAGTYSASKNTPKKSSGRGGRSGGGSKATGAAAARSEKAGNKREAAAAASGTKFGKGKKRKK